jgi:5-methyltetrahydrofolate--homocysteine methyltransferase
MLQAAGLPPGVAPERWNLERPETVHALHQAYVEAGSDLILTNTFGGTRLRLEKARLGDRMRAINLAAAKLARKAARESVFVLGDIGPIGMLLKPLGSLSIEEAKASFAEQASALAEGEVDAILIETMSDLGEAVAAVQGACQATNLPILVSMSFDTHGHTMMGVSPETAAVKLWELGVDVIGANCGRSLSETLEVVRKMRETVPKATLLAKPNAGLPHEENGESIYDVTPTVMAEYARKFVALGVKIFGGCCGSTPEHIRAVAAALRSPRT